MPDRLQRYYHVRSNGIAVAEPIHAFIGHYIKLMCTHLDNVTSPVGLVGDLVKLISSSRWAAERIVFRGIQKERPGRAGVLTTDAPVGT